MAKSKIAITLSEKAVRYLDDLVRRQVFDSRSQAIQQPVDEKIERLVRNRLAEERRGLTLSEAAKRLGQRSQNAYARYEQGKAMPSVEKLEQLLRAIAPNQRIVWRIAA